MSSATSAFTDLPVAVPARTARPGFFARFVAALAASREMAARREIARHKRMMDEITQRSEARAERKDLPF